MSVILLFAVFLLSHPTSVSMVEYEQLSLSNKYEHASSAGETLEKREEAGRHDGFLTEPCNVNIKTIQSRVSLLLKVTLRQVDVLDCLSA